MTGESIHELLDRCVTEGPENRIDPGLIARTLGLEPLQHILVYTKRNCGLGCLQLQATTDDATDNVTHLCLRMIGGGYAFAGTEASEVSLGLG